MPSAKEPCVSCKEKHVRCDEKKPQCNRCQARGLQCVRSRPKISFRPGSSARYDARFPKDQNWVNSNARKIRHRTLNGSAEEIVTSSAQARFSEISRPIHEEEPYDAQLWNSPDNDLSTLIESDYQLDLSKSSTTSHEYSKSSSSTNDHIHHDELISPQPTAYHFTNHLSISQNSFSTIDCSTNQANDSVSHQPLQNIQEACLWRYFVEELSPWFDITDPLKHFQSVVPFQALRYPPLLHAIFAVSARHLSRVPQYQTSLGIKYHDQLLPDLTADSAVEYLLRCMPALRQFHSNELKETREYIIATAVILRQFEEMEMEEDDYTVSKPYTEVSEPASIPPIHPPLERVNFLAIINAVVRSSQPQSLVDDGQASLFHAAYWMAVRQEVFYAFIRRQTPQMWLEKSAWDAASLVNKTVMHASQVAKWLWEDKSEDEWLRLTEQEAYFDQYLKTTFSPIFQRVADKSKGEVFPTVWYSSTIIVTGVQHLLISRMVLLAESPFLRKSIDSRMANRKVESEVRSMNLELCGIGIHHPQAPPALVNAVIGILLYGSFFTDSWEREALAGVVEKFKNVHAWPLPKALCTFK